MSVRFCLLNPNICQDPGQMFKIPGHFRYMMLLRRGRKCNTIKVLRYCAIRKSLTVETAKLLVHAFVNSRLDYCNSVLQGVRAVHLQKLQVIQNGAARIVARKRKFDSITSTIRDELHWLPIVQRIHFKQCMLVYRSLHGMAPSYIADVCIQRSFESQH